MRIITKFRDYYDTAAAYGLDSNVLYVRKTKEIIPKDYRRSYLPFWIHHRTNTRYECRNGMLGFCGKFYPFIQVTSWKENIKDKIFWNKESLDTWVEKISPGWKAGYKKKWGNWAQTKVRNHFARIKKDENLFHEHQVPILCKFDDGRLILNPKLKDLEFYTIFDAYQAHQEIAMYVGGVLNQSENMMAEISDEDRIAKHGFNQFSFRQDKGKGPKRKRKK